MSSVLDDPPRQLRDAAARLTAVRGELADNADEREELFDERATLIRQLRDAGVSRVELAELAGVSEDSVKLILSKRNRKNRPG